MEVNVSGSSDQLFTSIPSAGTFTVNAAPPPAAPAFTITGSVTDPSVSAGGSTPITATFTDTGGALTNGNIEVVVYDGSGTAVGSSADCTAASTTNSNVNIAAGGNQVISCTWTATGLTSGTYNVTGLAFSSGWSTEYKQTIIGTVTVGSGGGGGGGGAPAFTITGSVSDPSVSAGGSTPITATFTDTGGALTNGNIEVVVYNGSGTAVGSSADCTAASTTNSNVNIAAGGNQVISCTWTATGLTSGTYNVTGLAFSSGWSTEYKQTIIGTVTVGSGGGGGGGGGAPAFTITGSITDPSVSAGGSTPITATFTDTGGALTNGNIEVVVYDGSGTAVGSSADCTAASTTNSNVNIAAGGNQVISCTWTATGLTSGTYNVTGLAFSSGWSTEYKQTIIGTVTVQPPATTAPNAPTGLKATAGNATVGLSWTASSGATSYNVYRGTTSNGESTTPIASGLTSPAYTDNSAANGTKYYYYVTAINSVGPSGPSNEVSAEPLSSLLTAPTLQMPTAGNGDIPLNWSAVNGATSYNVYRGTTPGSEGTTPLATGVTGTTYTDSTVTNGVQYYFVVAAVSSTQTGPISNEVWATASRTPTFKLTAVANPNNVVVGQPTSITATAVCTADCSVADLANDNINVIVHMGAIATPSMSPSVNFTTNPTRSYILLRRDGRSLPLSD